MSILRKSQVAVSNLRVKGDGSLEGGQPTEINPWISAPWELKGTKCYLYIQDLTEWYFYTLATLI